MKLSPSNKRAQANMAPGIITAEGFLGDDPRPLPDIIADDEVHMKRLGLDWDAVADLLERLMHEGRQGLGEPVTLSDKWIVRTDEARGHLACPWEDGIFRKVNVIAKNKASGHTLFFTELSVHLLKEHHFLEGKGSVFRLEPEVMKDVLDL